MNDELDGKQTTNETEGSGFPVSGGSVLVVLFAFAMVAMMFGPMLWREHQNDRILREGALAVARVRDIQTTGNWVNNQPEVRITLEVGAGDAGTESFEAEATTVMSPVYLPRYQPGLMVEVRYDPNDRRRIALVEP